MVKVCLQHVAHVSDVSCRLKMIGHPRQSPASSWHPTLELSKSQRSNFSLYMRWAGKICSYTDEIITETVDLFERKVTNRFLCATLTPASLALVTERRKASPSSFHFLLFKPFLYSPQTGLTQATDDQNFATLNFYLLILLCM